MNTVVKSPTPLPAKTGLTVFRAADYMRYKARHYGVAHIHKTLEGCLKELGERKSCFFPGGLERFVRVGR